MHDKIKTQPAPQRDGTSIALRINLVGLVPMSTGIKESNLVCTKINYLRQFVFSFWAHQMLVRLWGLVGHCPTVLCKISGKTTCFGQAKSARGCVMVLELAGSPATNIYVNSPLEQLSHCADKGLGERGPRVCWT